jgi:diguanylate cyclase (GGDEF)-like protein
MREHVNIEVLANWVSMLRASVDGAILLSDDDDEARFYEGCAHEQATVIPATGVAVPLLDKMEQRGVHGLVAAVRGLPTSPTAPNMFQPALGDVASLLLFAKSSDRVIRDACGNAWLMACEKEVGPIANRVVSIARLLDSVRLKCEEEHVAYVDDQEPSKFIDWKTFELDWGRLSAILEPKGLSQVAIQQVRNLEPGKDLRSDLVEWDGMEAVRILAAATRMYRPRGVAAYNEISHASLMTMLRVAFDFSEIEGDEIYWRMRLWERANAKYPLLRKWRMLDPLGVVLDQRYWEHDLEMMLKMLKSGERLTMFKMDLDDFKGVNEKLGHGGGDAAIRLYCRIVKEILDPFGEIYRRGGDEVVAIAPGLAEEKAKDLAEKVRAHVEVDFAKWASENGLSRAPTVSVGLVVAQQGTPSGDVTRLADEAQLQAKQQGKNRVFFLGIS